MLHRGGISDCGLWAPFYQRVVLEVGANIGKVQQFDDIVKTHIEQYLDECTHCQKKANQWRITFSNRLSQIPSFEGGMPCIYFSMQGFTSSMQISTKSIFSSIQYPYFPVLSPRTHSPTKLSVEQGPGGGVSSVLRLGVLLIFCLCTPYFTTTTKSTMLLVTFSFILISQWKHTSTLLDGPRYWNRNQCHISPCLRCFSTILICFQLGPNFRYKTFTYRCSTNIYQ